MYNYSQCTQLLPFKRLCVEVSWNSEHTIQKRGIFLGELCTPVSEETQHCMLRVSLLEGDLDDISVIVEGATWLFDVLWNHGDTFKPAGDLPSISCIRDQFLERWLVFFDSQEYRGQGTPT